MKNSVSSFSLGQHYNQCPVCASSIWNWRSKCVDSNTYQIDRCNKCGYAFVNPRPSLEWLANWYSKSGHHTNESQRTDVTTFESVCTKERISPNSTIDAKRIINKIRELSAGKSSLRMLDVGCGYGFFSREALDQGFSVTPVELASTERSIAAQLLGIEPIASSFEDYSPNQHFNVVLMSQILEHAGDINLWADKAHRLLEKDGIFAIALPNFNSFLRFFLKENEPYITPPAHLNYFNPFSLSKLLEQHGFKVEAVQHISRIPSSTFEKRLPVNVPSLIPLILSFSQATLRMIDQAKFGMIINLYARKL